MSDEKTWVYHATEKPKIVTRSQAEELYENGWADTPAKFKGVLKKFNVDPGDELGVQTVGESIKGVVDAANGALNAKEPEDDEQKGSDTETGEGCGLGQEIEDLQ
jgi:Tfp pilus assembly protein PilP